MLLQFNKEISVQKLRGMVAKRMSEDPENFYPFIPNNEEGVTWEGKERPTTEQWSKYCERVRYCGLHDVLWGNNATLQAVCEVLQTKICVVEGGKPNVLIEPRNSRPGQQLQTLVIAYHADQHYDAAVPAPPSAAAHEGASAAASRSSTTTAVQDVEASTQIQPPPWTLCPIGLTLMHDAMMVVATGQTFSQKGLQEWMNRFDGPDFSCPTTKTVVPKSCVVPNFALRHAIEWWLAQNPTFKEE
jgi:hypothetical protein